jgi:hypothetical protein
MFGFLNKLLSKKSPALSLEDINGLPLAHGDKVLSLRYDMGICTLFNTNGEWLYVSEENKSQISFIKMIDAASKRQKVLKQ